MEHFLVTKAIVKERYFNLNRVKEIYESVISKFSKPDK